MLRANVSTWTNVSTGLFRTNMSTQPCQCVNPEPICQPYCANASTVNQYVNPDVPICQPWIKLLTQSCPFLNPFLKNFGWRAKKKQVKPKTLIYVLYFLLTYFWFFQLILNEIYYIWTYFKLDQAVLIF